MRMPEPGPLGETLFEAKLLAIVLALLVNSPGGGWVESVVTFATHLFFPTVLFLTVIAPQEHHSRKGDDRTHIQFRFRLCRHPCTARCSTSHRRRKQPGTGRMDGRIPA
jgi:hypothetical protein